MHIPIHYNFFLKLLNYIIYLFFLPIWYMQLLIPRNKKIWIFGAWYGEKFSDNSKYFYNYVKNNNSDVHPIWLTRNDEAYNEIKKSNGNVYYINSIKGIYYSLIAGRVFISSGKQDVNSFFINGALLFQLWHGNPIKKICLDDKFATSNTFLHKRILPILFPFIYEYNFDFAVSNASVFSSIFSTAFNLPLSKIIETGSPRNDSFYILEEDSLINSIRNNFSDCKICMYLPTFRGGGEVNSIFNLNDYDEDKLEEILTNKNLVLITKGHFIDDRLSSNSNSNKRIIHLSDKQVSDVNLVLKDVDLLITDYSGAYFDYLHTMNPIIFAAYDLENYLSFSREMYFEYSNIICGPLVENWEILYRVLDNFNFEDVDKILIEEKSRYFNKFLDGQNSERLFDKIMTIN